MPGVDSTCPGLMSQDKLPWKGWSRRAVPIVGLGEVVLMASRGDSVPKPNPFFTEGGEAPLRQPPGLGTPPGDDAPRWDNRRRRGGREESMTSS